MTARDIASEADRLIRERYSDAYEVLWYARMDSFLVASPRNCAEGGMPTQPTAVFVGYGADFEDAESLYAAALELTDEVDRLSETEEEW